MSVENLKSVELTNKEIDALVSYARAMLDKYVLSMADNLNPNNLDVLRAQAGAQQFKFWKGVVENLDYARRS